MSVERAAVAETAFPGASPANGGDARARLGVESLPFSLEAVHVSQAVLVSDVAGSRNDIKKGEGNRRGCC